MKIDPQNCKVVIWGYTLHCHTQSYIHQAFYRAFQHLGYQTQWLTNDSDISSFDFSNTLFLTEGQVDQKIPLRDDCLYMLHNCAREKYQSLFDKNKCFNQQVYTDDVLGRQTQKIDTCVHFDIPGKCLYIPWGTDLLPHEIEANKPNTVFNQESKKITWVGTVGDGIFGNINQINPFKSAAHQNGIEFQSFSSCKSIEENIQLVKNSYLAPTITGQWQNKVGYIPCRITKNISYGQFGLTNSARVSELFDHKIIFNPDTRRLFYDARERLSHMPVSELHALMDIVKNKHTYLNRIQTIIDFFNQIGATDV